ncbi:MAG: hypothetical protein A2087_09635 [Spirochaetes bacterium GWD1_61_31]|nr:MAG: hypothetical protein A2Y37_05275 [Spirochaetes bacterium GWB1_60_80]OHD33240.1 MAG: hypothetical protein A2004_09410 [Spirochaetes bacterium GWC1_61_12]OHD37786.1 MAG: hypothetical protein A2087_09635 [Spirochaetes bacterium GWD1_61_31]OHD42743.1 MAG: hypothetical protein A2Y35_05655 [Spirochaetes bacterium GWE1_60_18]OHD58594.1 MAG: hypothetical protein A2Y32_04575 [Spirochaetes bacterium GWF1_60_12]HAP44428.1 hypothetical protein [Spirochaetaceae bacterium]
MIDRLLYADWDEAPAAMDFELPYGLAIERCRSLVALLAKKEAPGDAASWDKAVELYVHAPAIVNVALNYLICVELGLPLHPTEYIDLNTAPRKAARYPASLRASVERLVIDAIGLARSAYRLDAGFGAAADRFLLKLPAGLEKFVYTSTADKYTWRGAEPSKVKALADSVLARGQPSLALGAAHGAIMAGLMLAEYLDCPLWFVRFSLFKRRDSGPVITECDIKIITDASNRGEILVFDEDSASGTTLTILAAELRKYAPKLRTGAVIRHITTSFQPDHVGKTWWD